MTFNLQTAVGRHGSLAMEKLDDLDETGELENRDRFKKYVNCMECAEEFTREDVGLALYYFLRVQAERI